MKAAPLIVGWDLHAARPVMADPMIFHRPQEQTIHQQAHALGQCPCPGRFDRPITPEEAEEEA